MLNTLWQRQRNFIEQRPVRIVLSLIIVLGAASVLGYGFVKNVATLRSYRWQINWTALGVTLALYLVDLLLTVIAWNLITERLAKLNSFRKSLRIYTSTLLARRLPGSIWHVIGRAVLYEKEGVSKTIISLSSVVEFVMLFLVGGIFYLLILPWQSAGSATWWILLCLLPLGALIGYPRLISKPVALISKRQLPSEVQRADVLRWVVLYIGVWAVTGAILYAAILIVYPLPIAHLPGILAASTLSGLVGMLAVFAPTGLGVQEVTLSALLGAYLPVPLNIVVAVGIRVLMTLYDLLGLLISMVI